MNGRDPQPLSHKASLSETLSCIWGSFLSEVLAENNTSLQKVPLLTYLLILLKKYLRVILEHLQFLWPYLIPTWANLSSFFTSEYFTEAPLSAWILRLFSSSSSFHVSMMWPFAKAVYQTAALKSFKSFLKKKQNKTTPLYLLLDFSFFFFFFKKYIWKEFF